MSHPGHRVGEYILIESIGGGTFGTVWLARHHAWHDRLAAVKLPTDPAYVRALQREGLAIAKVKHPNIGEAIAFDATAEVPYLVLEYVSGGNLRAVLRECGKFPPDQTRAILTQILQGLQAAHDAGIVHRDLKPENVLVHPNAIKDGFAKPGTVKLTDFGLVSVTTTSADSIAMSMQRSLADAGKIVGTLDYMSPEQRAGEKLDARSDLFAVGVIMFELLTGRKPVGGERPSDAGLPKQWDGLYLRSCAPLPRRFENASGFLEAMSGAFAPVREAPMPIEPDRRASRPTPAEPIEQKLPAEWVRGLIKLVLLVAVVAGGWAFFSGRFGDPGLLALHARAIAGDSSAMSSLGWQFDSDNTDSKHHNDAEAVRWYRRAADAGHAAGMHNLGVMYANGRGVAKDEAEAVRWFRRAADAGNAYGIGSLGWAYVVGQGGLVRDRAKGIALLRRGFAGGHAWSGDRLRELGERP